MTIKNNQVHIVYYAYDSSGPKTGDAANHVLKLRRDGTLITPTNSPVEISAADAPGMYELLVTETENTGRSMALIGRSTTSGVFIQPVYWTNEHNVSRYDDGLSPGTDVWLNTVIDGTLTAKQLLALIASACAGLLSGAGTGTVIIKAINDGTTTRITATVDSLGNRLNITLNPP